MLNFEDIKKKLASLAVPEYRARQIYQAFFREGKSSYSDITTLPEGLRETLTKEIPPWSVAIEDIRKTDDTEKCVFRLHDGNYIETVLMNFRDNRHTVCVSSQIGCQMGCMFCATGKSGYSRNLSYEEISDQVLFFAQELIRRKKRLSNVVYMGMGEPLMNYVNVIKSIYLLNDMNGLNLGARSITISTSGICEGIMRLAEEKLQVNLAISLHSANQAVREQIMPIARKYSLPSLMASVKEYIRKTNRRVSYEYVMLKNINDSPVQAAELADLVKGQLCHINLIPYNATGILGITGSDKETIKDFENILKKRGIAVTVRVSLGQGINAACGQLAGKKKKIIS